MSKTGDFHKVAIEGCNSYNPDEIIVALKRALNTVDFRVPTNKNILIKPNAVTNNTPEQCTATNYNIIDAVCTILSENKANNKLTIADSSSYYHKGYTGESFKTLKFTDVAKKHKANILFFEHGRIKRITPKSEIVSDLYIADLEDFDLVINLPKLKVHRISKFSGAMKNLYGCIPGGTKQVYHALLEERDDYKDAFGHLILDTYLEIQPQLNILDGIMGLERDGPAATGDPVRTNFLLASKNGLAMDFAIAQLIGEKPEDVSFLKAAIKRNELKSKEVKLVGKVPDFKFKRLQPVKESKGIAKIIEKHIFKHLVVKPSVNLNRCSRCGKCVEKCIAKAIKLEPGKSFDMSKCIWCYGCESYCKNKAIYMKQSLTNKIIQKIRRMTRI